MYINPWYHGRIIVVDDKPPKQIPTGLLWPSGHPIVKVIQKEPMGFIHFKERDEYGEEEEEETSISDS